MRLLILQLKHYSFFFFFFKRNTKLCSSQGMEFVSIPNFVRNRNLKREIEESVWKINKFAYLSKYLRLKWKMLIKEKAS